MRIIFLAVDDEFAGEMQRYLFQTNPQWIVGSVLATQAIYKHSPAQAGLMVLKKSGPRYLLEMAKMKILRRLAAGDDDSATTPEALAEQYDVPIHRSADINDDASLDWLRSFSPDLIISTNFSHYVGKTARQIAKVGSWNLHKSYLPHNRGMAPSFYALLNDDPHAGVTLHVLEKGFDTGAIIDQRKVDIIQGDTVYDLNQRSSIVGGQMLADLLAATPLERIGATQQLRGEWPDHTYPSPADIRRFIKAGHSFDKWSLGDLRGIFG